MSRELAEFVRELLERKLLEMVTSSPTLVHDLHAAFKLGFHLSPRLVWVGEPEENAVDILVEKESPIVLTPTHMSYLATREALPRAVKAFGRQKFTVARVVDKLRGMGYGGFNPKHVSLILSKNKVPGINLKKSKRQGEKGKMVNVFQKTR